MPGPSFAAGFRRLLDTSMNYVQNSPPVYLRIKNFADQSPQIYDQLGFLVSPEAGQPAGTTDVLIQPPPAIENISMTKIAFSGGRLRMGAKSIMISHTFVLNFARNNNIDDPAVVFEQNLVVGLVIDNRVWEIVEVDHKEAFGGTIMWYLSLNAPEPLGV